MLTASLDKLQNIHNRQVRENRLYKKHIPSRLYEYKADRERHFNSLSEHRGCETSVGLHLKDTLFLSNLTKL